jgi:hypothetical protein
VFDAVQDPQPADAANTRPARRFRFPPALALWLIAPVFGEMFSGSTPLNEYLSPLTILVFGMLYGSGAILVRETVLRVRGGWRSLLLLGAAYGIYEEGLVVRSFFDPNWMDLGRLGVYGRVAGVNWVWTEHLTIFHALISIAAGIVFVEMLYPERRAESWIGGRGWGVNLLAFAAMLPVGSLLNPYDAPDAALGFCWLAIALLAVFAGKPLNAGEGLPRSVPRPRRFWITGFLAAFLQFLFVYAAADADNPPFPVAMILIGAFDLFLLWLILRWSGNARGWDDRHRLALIGGPVAMLMVIQLLAAGGRNPLLYFTNPLVLFLSWRIYRRIERRVARERSMPAVAAGGADRPAPPLNG